jgi:surface polysaccharide O-acyltransferase-like enzyme
VWHYQVPITEWQRAIALGFTPYLLVFVTLFSILRRRGWQGLNQYNLLEPLAYLGLVLFWVLAAWRRDRPAAVGEPVEQPVESLA